MAGVVLILVGGVFEGQKRDEQKRVGDFTFIRDHHSGLSTQAYIDASYWNGAADLELFQNGRTSFYEALLNESNSNLIAAQRELNTSKGYEGDIKTASDRKELFQGAAIASSILNFLAFISDSVAAPTSTTATPLVNLANLS